MLSTLNLISIETAMSRFIGDFAITGSEDLDLDDMRGWIVEALQQLSWGGETERVFCPINIENFKACLPADCLRIERLFWCEHPFANQDVDWSGSTGLDLVQKSLAMYGAKQFSLVRTQQDNEQHYFRKPPYRLDKHIVFPDCETGKILVMYQRWVTDEKDNMLVPDAVEVSEALFWYCAYKLSIRGFEFPQAEMRSMRSNKRYWTIHREKVRSLSMPGFDDAMRLSAIMKSPFTNPNFLG